MNLQQRHRTGAATNEHVLSDGEGGMGIGDGGVRRLNVDVSGVGVDIDRYRIFVEFR